MTLDDQIRAMADARAAQVGDVEAADVQRGTVSIRRRSWLVAAAAAVVLLIGGVAWAVASGDDPDTEVADGEDGAENAFVRWIPATPITAVRYGGAGSIWSALAAFGGPSEVALVAPAADGEAIGSEWTTIHGSYGLFPSVDLPAESLSVSEFRGRTLATLRRGENGVASITSTHHSGPAFEALESELTAATSIAEIAEIVAGIDDSVVRYSGPPPRQGHAISGGDGIDVFSVEATSPEQIAAVFGNDGARAEGWADFFALESADDLLFDDEYVTAAAAAPVPIGTDEWLAVVDDLLGPEPAVTFPPIELYGFEGGRPDLADPAAAIVAIDNDGWTVELRLAAPTSNPDGGAELIAIGAVELHFDIAPGAATSLLLKASMPEAEAQRYVDAINTAFTPAIEMADTIPRVAGACASNAVPDAEMLEESRLASSDRTPLDLDQDGVDDLILVRYSDGGSAQIIAKLADGWTNWLDLVAPFEDIVATPTGGFAAADLDGDGGLEFFVSVNSGNTSTGAQLVSVSECVLSSSADESDVITVMAWGNSCFAGGCLPRVACVDGGILAEITQPADGLLLEGEPDPAAIQRWTSTQYRYVNGRLIPEETTFSEFAGNERPAEAPTRNDQGVINCTPGEPSTNEVACGTNPAPSASVIDAATHLGPDRTPFDLDADGTDDELLTYRDSNGEPWLIARTNTGWTTPMSIGLGDAEPFETPTGETVPRFSPTLQPDLVPAPDGQPAVADLNGDGRPEFFTTVLLAGLGGDLQQLAAPVTLLGSCELSGLRVIPVPGSIEILAFALDARLSCVKDGLRNELARTITAAGGVEQESRSAYLYSSLGEGTVETSGAEIGTDPAPTAADYGVIDCTDGR